MDHTLGVVTILNSSMSVLSLNPCFSGPYSRSRDIRQTICGRIVLILVLVDHTLGDNIKVVDIYRTKCLNPCFSGPYSRRLSTRNRNGSWTHVLILVLVDHTLGVVIGLPMLRVILVLILVLVDHALGDSMIGLATPTHKAS